MGSSETYLRLDVTVVEVTENDGPRFLSRGSERLEETLTLRAAVQRYGQARVARLLREQADALGG